MKPLDIYDTNTIAFPRLGLEFEISDTAFTLFGLEIKWYGLLITLGMLLAFIYAFKNMKSYGIDPERTIDVVIGGVLGGLVGARLYFVIMEWDSYKNDILSVFNIRNGGLAIYGGIIGAVLVGGLVAKFKKVKLLPLLDLVGIGFLLGQGIGRWGNFTNQEAFGCNTDTLFGMSGGKIQNWILNYGGSATLSGDETMSLTQPVHPCFLYESIWCLLGFVLLAIFAKKIRKFDGQIFLMYTAWYGLERFFIESLRIDSLMIGQLRISQLVAAVCFIVSVILLIVIGFKVRRMGGDYQLYVNTEESKQLIRESEEKLYEKKNEKNTKNTEESADDKAEKSESTEKINENENDDNKENQEEN